LVLLVGVGAQDWAGVHVGVRQAQVLPLASIAIGLQWGATGQYACWRHKVQDVLLTVY